MSEIEERLAQVRARIAEAEGDLPTDRKSRLLL